MLRTKLEFSCDMPYDAVEANGVFVRLPGRGVARAMAAILADLGCAVGAVRSAGDHGWEFSFRYKAIEASCLVTVIHGVLVQVFGPAGYKPWFGKARPPDDDFVEILAALGRAIDADPRFRDIGWFNSEEVASQQAGARSPTSPYDPSPCPRSFGGDGHDEVAEESSEDDEEEERDEPGDSRKRAGPMRRLAARLFDHVVIAGGALFVAIAQLHIAPPLPVAGAVMRINFNGYLLALGVAVGGGLMNAAFVRWFGATPGKWLCGVRVLRVDEQRLGWSAALKREAEAVAAGCAMFIPLPMLLAFGVGFVRLVFKGETGWDRRRCAIVLEAPALLGGAPTIGLCIVASYAVLFFQPHAWTAS